METTYLGLVITIDFFCAKDFEWSKLTSIKNSKSICLKFSFVDKSVLLLLSRSHAMLFQGTEDCYMKLNEKTWKTVQSHTINLSNVSVEKNKSYNNNHECLGQINLPTFKHVLAKKQIMCTFRLFYFRSTRLSNHRY